MELLGQNWDGWPHGVSEEGPAYDSDRRESANNLVHDRVGIADAHWPVKMQKTHAIPAWHHQYDV